MVDPVILVQTSIAYERTAIRKWLTDGHRQCPATGLPINPPFVLLSDASLQKVRLPFPPLFNPSRFSAQTPAWSQHFLLLCTDGLSSQALHAYKHLDASPIEMREMVLSERNGMKSASCLPQCRCIA